MVEHTAFLDLERAITKRLSQQFTRRWVKLYAKIKDAIDAGNYFRAHELIDTLDLPMARNRVYLWTMGTMSLLLGQSRLKKPGPLPPTPILESATRQLVTMLERNALEALRSYGHRQIALLGAGQLAKREDRSQALRVKLNTQGRAYFALAASLYVSRLSSYGFLQEAEQRGVEFYEFTAVLDERLCPVCQVMDGKVFPVNSGFAHAEHVLSLTDPDALKQAAPFWSQHPDKVRELLRYSIEDLIEAGMALPPLHPLCRCVVVPTTQRIDLSPSDQSDRIGVAMEALYGVGVDTDPTIQGSPISPSKVSPALASALGFAVGYRLAGELFAGPTPWALLPIEDEEEEDESFEESFGGLTL